MEAVNLISSSKYSEKQIVSTLRVYVLTAAIYAERLHRATLPSRF